MIIPILCVLFLLSGSYFISVLFGKDVEETIPIWMISAILFVYIFGIFGVLKAGYYAIIVISIIMLTGAIVLIFAKKISLKKIITPGLIIYLIMIAIAFTGHEGRLFIKNDEFSHWGLVVKNMFTLDAFGGDYRSGLIFRDYPPATAIFQYIILNISGKYSEGSIYTAMNLLYFSLIIPLFKNTSFRKPLGILSRVVVSLLLPVALFSNFFVSIYVDAIMAVVFACSLLAYFNGKNDKLMIVNVSLALSFLVLIKGSGVGLAVIALIIIMADRIFFQCYERNVQKLKDMLSHYMVVLIPAVSSFFMYFTWKIYLSVYNISNTWTASNNTSSLISRLINHDLKTFEIIKNFSEHIFSTHSDSLPESLSYFSWICVVILALAILTNGVNEEKSKKRIIVLVVTTVICCLIYLGSILLSYLTVFSEYEAVNLASINRYSNTFMLGWCLLIAGIAFSANINYKERFRGLFTGVIALILCIFVSAAPILDITILAADSANQTKKLRDNFASFEQVKKIVNFEEEILYIIHSGSKGYEYCVYNYMAAPKRLSNLLSFGLEPYYEGDIWTKTITLKEYTAVLADNGVDYVYVSYANETFNKNYGSLFTDGTAENLRLYDVNIDDTTGDVSLDIIE